MAVFDDRIRKLIAGARANTEESRIQVLEQVVDFLISPEIYANAEERASLLEIYDALAGHIPAETRLQASRRVAAADQPPLELAMRLATDSARVASPILRKVDLDEDRLLDIIAGTGKAHHLLIAERPGLSKRVWLALSGKAPTAPDERTAAALPASAEAEEQAEAKTEIERKRKPVPPKPPLIKRLGDLVGADEVTGESTLASTKRNGTDKAFGREGHRDVGLRDDGGRDLERSFAAPPTGPALIELEEIDQSRGPAFRWHTDRQGRIVALSPMAERAFARRAASLRGLYFFALAVPLEPGNGNLGRALIRHHPIRDIPVEIEGATGRRGQWNLRASAKFDHNTGRFLGYEGTARETGESGEAERTVEGGGLEDRVVDALLREAMTPAEDALAATGRLMERARTAGDHGAVAELAAALEAGFHLKTMIEDIAAHRRAAPRRISTFRAREALGQCLAQDAVRHGGLTRFRLDEHAADGLLSFDQNLLDMAVLRMLEVARAHGDGSGDTSIDVTLGNAGRLDVRIPMGVPHGGLREEEILFSPTQYLHRRLAPAMLRTRPLFGPEFGLSVMREMVRTAGGEIRLLTTRSGARELVLSVPLSSK